MIHRQIAQLQNIHVQVDFHATDTTHARAANGHLLAAENHIARLASMTTVVTGRITQTLLSAELQDILFEQTCSDLHAHFDSESLQRIPSTIRASAGEVRQHP
jgi:hypothetical protein